VAELVVRAAGVLGEAQRGDTLREPVEWPLGDPRVEGGAEQLQRLGCVLVPDEGALRAAADVAADGDPVLPGDGDVELDEQVRDGAQLVDESAGVGAAE
jgi:hypothetical protein